MSSLIDPIHSLSFSIQSNRGVYAVLLGSGVSRSAKIPTGWDITLDLVRKLASVSGQDCEPSPEQWYRDTFGKAPDYSELLDALAKTPSERQQLLRVYWEATVEEREEGAKRPTQAHRAIADLVAQGFIKVIITTNFDRLMETALADVGIAPTILSSPDQVHGSQPLIHTRCCLFKVHGDYLDTRIRNTPDELDSYPKEFDSLLDRIFDEFGLIVCGWSADWDEALRRAIVRAPSRRFATYWAVRGDPSESATKLIEHRGAQLVSIKDADTFFATVQQHVQSLEQFSRPHPLSTEAAVASLKRYLSESKYRIQLADLVGDEVERVMEATAGPRFVMQGGPAPDGESITTRVRAYEAACTTLLAMAIQAGYWGDKSHVQVWQRAIYMLATRRSESGYQVWLDLQQYPATLLLYALGLGAIEAGKLDFLADIFQTSIARVNREDVPAVQVLPPFRLFDRVETPRMLEGMDRRFAPLNDWLQAFYRSQMKRLIPNDDRYALCFDKLEMLMCLSHAYLVEKKPESFWGPAGCFGYRRENQSRIFDEINNSIEQQGNNSPFVKSKLFGQTADECKAWLPAFAEFFQRISRSWH